ncbi:MAG: MBL fold metallo-hydrolase [Bacteroidetes bacterium]|nr:MAG: MBL fold metallo-hydrolase [Bacteroidota bacterium]
MGLKITVLGTGTSQGVPVVACSCKVCNSNNPKDKRLRTAILVKTPKNTIVIDAGPDFRQQMLRENVSKVNAVFITHNHKDHTGGLDDVRAFNWILKQPMEVYGRSSVLKSIKKDFDYAFEEEKYPGVPQINLHVIENKPFSINGDNIIPIDAMHAQMPVFGFRIGDFSYLTDASFLTDEELDKMKGSKYIIINALRKEKHYSHFNVEEAIDILQYLKPEKGYLTHISHQMGLHEEINKELPPGIKLAYDGLKLII